MGFVVPQVITEDRASGAQIVDGSLKFERDKDQCLTRDPSGTAGNSNTFTISFWYKKTEPGSSDYHLFSAGDSSTNRMLCQHGGFDGLQFARVNSSVDANRITTRQFRDYSGWYHVVFAVDTTIASPAADRIKVYVNGVRETDFSSSSDPTQNTSFYWNADVIHSIGTRSYSLTSNPFDGYMSQFYNIDGQALGPGYFGFTDPLTGTWRPKKFRAEGTTVNNGTTWSSYVTGDSDATDVPTRGFNGDFTNGWRAQANGDSGTLYTATFTPPNPIHFQKLRVYAQIDYGYIYSDTQWQINGVNQTRRSSAQWIDITNVQSPLTSLSITAKNNGGTYEWARIYAIEVDGVVMVDSTTQNLAYGTNGFYLPMDGNSPIGEDKSGNGNDWTPVNFGGSAALDKATGALPILNTFGDNGKVALPSVRTDSAVGAAATCVLALPLVGNANDVSNQINSGSSTKTITVNGNSSASSTQSNFYGGSYYFDNAGDYLSVSSTTDFDFGTGDYTAESWVYLTTTGDEYVCNMQTNNTGSPAPWWGINFYSTNLIRVGRTGDSNGDPEHMISYNFTTNRWYHIAVSRESGVSRVFLDGVKIDEQNVNRSVIRDGNFNIGAYYNGGLELGGYLQDFRIYKGVAKYTSNFIPASTNPDILPDTPSGVSGGSKLTKVIDGGSVEFSGGNNGSDISWTGTVAATHTLDFYVYASGGQTAGAGPIFIADGTDGYQFDFSTGTNNLIRAEKAGGGSDTGYQSLNGGWNHIRMVVEGSSAAMYINGVASGTFAPAGGTIGPATFYIGTKARLGSTVWFRGFICNVRIIEAALTGTDSPVIDGNGVIASSEGGTSAIFLWPGVNSLTENTGTDGDTITATASPVLTKFNPFTTDINTVRGQETGYATWNPLVVKTNNSLSNGNLTASHTASTGWTGGVWNANSATIVANTGVSSGSWYWEVHIDSESAPGYTAVGITTRPVGGPYYVGYADNGIAYTTTYIYQDSAYGSGTGSLPTTAAGDTIGVALDMDNGHIWFSKNGIYVYGNPYTRTGSQSSNIIGTMYPAVSQLGSATGFTATANFGQKPFKFPPPDGFQPLNASTVRPSTVIARPDQYVGIVTYTGTGSTRDVGGLNFSPDLVIIKDRSTTNNVLWSDTVRRPGRRLISNLAIADATDTDRLSAFTSDGFTVGNAPDTNDNSSSNYYVGWAWKAGGGARTLGVATSFYIDDVDYGSAAAAGLSGGDLTITGASVGTKQGFSIIQYQGNNLTGQTIKHGLTQKPDFIIVKNKLESYDWMIYHKSMGATYYGLFGTSAFLNNADIWADTEPTNEHFYVSVHNSPAGYSNGPNGEFISYLWHDVPGLQKFGSYQGNGSDDGTYVELGFRPALVIIKGQYSCDWIMADSEREQYNVMTKALFPNRNYYEAQASTNFKIDFLSNGFKLRNADGSAEGYNYVTNPTHIYAAWAEAPSFNLYGAQSNAR